MQTCVSEMRTTTMVSSLNLMILHRWARLLWITVTMGVEGKQQWIQHMVTLEGNWLWVSEWVEEIWRPGFTGFETQPLKTCFWFWLLLLFSKHWWGSFVWVVISVIQENTAVSTCTLSTGRNGMQLWQYWCARWQMWQVYWNCQWLILGTGMKEKVGWGPATDRSLRK